MADRYALFGHPVSHSRSPEIHHRFAELTGESIRYELIDCPPQELAATVHRFIEEGGHGGNVTLPHKQAALSLCDVVSADAERAGAVNTLAVLEDGRLFGDNTDGVGLVRDLTVNHGVVISGRRVLVIGAGGAARGAIGALLDEAPATLVIANRTAVKAEAIAADFAAANLHSLEFEALNEAFDIIINATSASLAGEVPKVPGVIIGAHTLAYDMFYANDATAFLAWAKEQGAARCLDGWGMMVEQAAESFFIWRGVRPETSGLLERKA
ncbi:MAG TPA: shikimate dehydrogenase [Gammaproteobacteria bacterium]|nr:shikimate dehydrogenase [Gammaproteobacteria bacterium]